MSTEDAHDRIVAAADDPKTSRVPYFVAIAVEIILLYVINNFLSNHITALAPYVTNTYPSFIVKSVNALASFKVPFLSSKFISCLWAINLAITCALLGNLALTLYHPRWFHHLIKGLLLAIAILPVYVTWHLFPFDFKTPVYETLARVILLVLAGGLAIGGIVRIVLFLKYVRQKIESDREKVRNVLLPASVVATPETGESETKRTPEPPASQPPA